MWQRYRKGTLLLRRNNFEDLNLSKLFIKVSSNLTGNKTFCCYKDISTNISFQNNSQNTNICKLRIKLWSFYMLEQTVLGFEGLGVARIPRMFSS
jgi:hypothetical protein